MVGQRLIITACRLHQVGKRESLLGLLTAPLHHLVDPCPVVWKVDTLSAAAYVTGHVVHEQAGRELVLGDVDAHALAEILVKCHL